MSTKKPQPLVSSKTHDSCPVCGETTYSSAGVHPQCAMRRADEQRMEQVKLRKPEETSQTLPKNMNSWQKVCPKCKSVQHVRKKVCSCGLTFALRSPPSNREDEAS